MRETNKRIIDVCCGSRMFWFDKKRTDTVYMDKRIFESTCCDGRHINVAPDIVGDFRKIPFEDETFSLVVFDPPHLIKAGESSWLVQKYGKLNPEHYQEDIRTGFKECFRVLKPDGVLIFKWNETDISVSEIVSLSPYPPLFGHRSGKRSNTHWMCFMKDEREIEVESDQITTTE